RIFGHLLTDNGLLAILDGCPLLESLDMEDGDYILFSNNVFDRYMKQIKKKGVTDRYLGDRYEGAISGYGNEVIYRLLDLLTFPRENSDDSYHSVDDP
ncbi:hypothetical protein L195_g058670, partial [Trifolium pratense]